MAQLPPITVSTLDLARLEALLEKQAIFKVFCALSHTLNFDTFFTVPIFHSEGSDTLANNDA